MVAHEDGIAMIEPVTIILSELNSARTIRRCIRSILAQDYQGEMTLLIVDGGSNDETLRAIIETLSEAKRQVVSLQMVKGVSEAAGQNLLIGMARTEILLFTNSDCYVPPDWVSRHVEWLRRGYDLVGGRVFWGGDKYSVTWNMEIKKGTSQVQEQGSGLGFSNCSTRKSLIKKMGELHDMKGHQDTHFAFQAVKLGYRMLLDFSIVVYHDHPFGSVYSSFRRALGYGHNHAIVARLVFGRLVISKQVGFVTPRRIVNEFFSIAGILSWKDNISQARANGIPISLFQFVMIRQLGWMLGQWFGVTLGAIQRNPTIRSIWNLH